MFGSVIIIGLFVLGAVMAYFNILPAQIIENDYSFNVLCALMLCVGFSIGNDTKILRSFKTLNPRLLLLPFATIFGTLAATALISLVLDKRSPADCMAVGSGFAYYSLSSVIISGKKGADLATIALLSNIIRELVALSCAPLLVKYFGKLAPISVGGATSMDTTLPVITRYCGKDFVVISTFHGFVVDFSVPFLVTFFCSF